MLNREERGKILKLLKEADNLSTELQKTMSLLMEIRDKAQKGFEQASSENVRLGILEEEIQELLKATPEEKKI